MVTNLENARPFSDAASSNPLTRKCSIQVKYLTIFFRLLMIDLYLFQKLSQSAETHTVPYTLTCIRIIGNMEKNSLFKKG